jgi:hypothetical protein
MRDALLLATCLAAAPPAFAGTACETTEVGPAQLAAAADTARWTHAALEAGGGDVALLSRAGTDLSKYGLHYSHVAFVVRDHPDGPWTVVHLLNRCGTDRSALFAQGLVNYFADGLVAQDARIDWLAPPLAAQVAAALRGPVPHAVHDARYNVISRPDVAGSQNSTEWVLDVLTAARLPPGTVADRAPVLARQRADGFVPDTLAIAYSRRVLGGLFSANADFGEHALATRVGGDYPVVTVRAILRHLEGRGEIAATRERRAGRESTSPGPA